MLKFRVREGKALNRGQREIELSSWEDIIDSNDE